MTEAELEVVGGDGVVQADGSYTINSGNTMTVEVRYEGFTKQIELSKCN